MSQCLATYLNPCEHPILSSSRLILTPDTQLIDYLRPFFLMLGLPTILRLITLSRIDVVTNSNASETSSVLIFCLCFLLTRARASGLHNSKSEHQQKYICTYA